MSTNIGRDFTSFIPSLTDDANIQEAFRMYHYGTEDGSEPGPAIELTRGIEYYLDSLQDQITNIEAGTQVVQDLTNTTDLNSVLTSGVYRRSSSPGPNLNYPESVAGLLNVIAATETVIYQIYQTLGGATGTNNYYWRGRDAAGNWSAWAQGSKVGHTHDDRYYTETEINGSGNLDALFVPRSSLTAGNVVVTDSNKRITTSSIITASELEALNNIGSTNIKDALDDRYTKEETARIFVQSSAPISPVANDLWIW